MNYRCPKCSHRLKVRTLFFHDISTCSHCGTKVVLGDVLAFFMAALTMLVAALTSLYVFSNEVAEYFVAAGYAVAIGMLSGIVVLLVLGFGESTKLASAYGISVTGTMFITTCISRVSPAVRTRRLPEIPMSAMNGSTPAPLMSAALRTRM